MEKTDDLLLIDEPILKIAIYDKRGSKDNIYNELQVDNKFKKVISGNNWLDISNKDINKGLALEILQQKLNISQSQTMAFGDYYNDLEMMQKAKYSYAMKNAEQDIKDIAQFQTKYDNNNNGVIREILM